MSNTQDFTFDFKQVVMDYLHELSAKI